MASRQSRRCCGCGVFTVRIVDGGPLCMTCHPPSPRTERPHCHFCGQSAPKRFHERRTAMQHHSNLMLAMRRMMKEIASILRVVAKENENSSPTPKDG